MLLWFTDLKFVVKEDCFFGWGFFFFHGAWTREICVDPSFELNLKNEAAERRRYYYIVPCLGLIKMLP